LTPSTTKTKSAAAERARRTRKRARDVPKPQLREDASELEKWIVEEELLDDRDHLRGCPGGRIEAFPATKAAVVNSNGQIVEPAAPVTTVRCVECGGQNVIEDPFDEVFADAPGAESSGD